jgi:hypothetical protein
MDSLVDLVCFYYRKALVDLTPKILNEVKQMPFELYEHICAMPTKRPTIYYRTAILTDTNTFEYGMDSSQSYFTNGILSYPLRTDISKLTRYYYKHSYVVLPGNILDGRLELYRDYVPDSIVYAFYWDAIRHLIINYRHYLN